jgi:Sulfotransferase domain
VTRHFLIIGAQRCATTYLRAILDAHPDIAMALPVRPEPKVFMSEELAAHGLAWYRKTYFAHATSETVYGDKSTSYLEDAAAASRARSVLGAADILVMLRDPIDRAVSNWRFSRDSGLEERPLAQALEENLAGSRAWDHRRTSVSPYAYLERGRYIGYLRPWFARFGAGVHVLFLEDSFDNAAWVGGVYAALHVDEGFVPAGLGTPVNASRSEAPPLEEHLTARLREHFRDSDHALRARLGRDLPWPVA